MHLNFKVKIDFQIDFKKTGKFKFPSTVFKIKTLQFG